MNAKLRHSLYWSVIVLSILTGYIYQHNLLAFGRLFFINLVPGQFIETTDGVVEVAAGQGGLFYINTKLNNAEVRFLIDTGASSISIDKHLAASIGVDVKNLAFNQVYQTANGPAKMASAKIDTLQVGAFQLKDVYVSISEVSHQPLLGMSFLSRLQSYTFKGNSLYLKFY